MTVWLNRQPASGKSTLACALKKRPVISGLFALLLEQDTEEGVRDEQTYPTLERTAGKRAARRRFLLALIDTNASVAWRSHPTA